MTQYKLYYILKFMIFTVGHFDFLLKQPKYFSTLLYLCFNVLEEINYDTNLRRTMMSDVSYSKFSLLLIIFIIMTFHIIFL